MEREISDFRKTGEHGCGEERSYTQTFRTTCPVDASKVVHTVRFLKATCTRVDDTVDDFYCSRDSGCVKCTDNYR